MTESMTKTQLVEEFAHPGNRFRGAPFWAWNSRMTEEKIDYMLESLKDMGMGGGHIHSRTGMDNPYLGEEFMNLVKYSVEKGKELGLLTYLYDEDRWPSGFCGGLVTKDHRYRMRFLVFSPERLEGKEIATGGYRSNGQAVRSNERTFLGRYRVRLVQECLADYGRMREDEPLKEGDSEWFAYLEVSGDSPWFNNEAYVNTLDRKAVERFVELTHEKYAGALGEEFGKSIFSIFTDEPQLARKTLLDFAGEKKEIVIPFTDDLEESFQETYGESLLEHLPELFWELPDGKVSVIRYEYHDHVAERFAGAYADTLGSWCQAHGIALTGHMMDEPTLTSQTVAVGEAMRSYRAFGLPGIDMLNDSREFSTAKQAQSASHQYGRAGVMSEIYGVTGWDFDFRGHKLAGDWQAALGVTLRVPHLTWTSMEGEAKRDYPASIGYQSPWYKEYSLVETYFARVNTILTRGTPRVRLAVIHPIESYWLLWGPKAQTAAAREDMEENFAGLIRWLLLGTVDFDFLAESLLPGLDCSVREKTLQVGCMRYDMVLVANCRTLRGTTLDILERFREAGGRVIFAGETPDLEDARPSGRGRALAEKCERIAFSKRRILEAVKEIRDVEIRNGDGTVCESLIYQMREEGQRRWLFVAWAGEPYVACRQDIPQKRRLRLLVAGRFVPTVYDAMTGEIYETEARYLSDGRTEIPFSLYDQDSLLLGLDPAPANDTSADSPGIRQISPGKASGVTVSRRQIEIPSRNPAVFGEPNVCVLDLARYRLDEEEWHEEEEILRLDDYCRKKLGYPLRQEALAQPWTNPEVSGSAHRLSLRFQVEAGTALKDVSLALENDERTEIFLDGAAVVNKATGWYVDRCIRRVPLPGLTAGSHTLQVNIPFCARENVEAMFLLGDFTVELAGREKILHPSGRMLAFCDITRQGYPFYGGNVTWQIPFTSHGGEVWLSASLFRSPLLKAAVDGVEKGPIAFSPYRLSLGSLPSGSHILELTAYGNRANTFGHLHNTRLSKHGEPPNSWRTKGEEWSYEYQLKAAGLLKAPTLWEEAAERGNGE